MSVSEGERMSEWTVHHLITVNDDNDGEGE